MAFCCNFAFDTVFATCSFEASTGVSVPYGDELGVEYGPASTSVCSEYVRVIFLFFALASSSPVSMLPGSGWLCDSSCSLGWLVRPYFCWVDNLPLLLELVVRDTAGRGELGGDGDVRVAVTGAFVMMSSSL